MSLFTYSLMLPVSGTFSPTKSWYALRHCQKSNMKRAVTCPRCGRTGTVRLEPVLTQTGTRLFIIGIEGPFVRTDRTSALGQPLIRCDKCNAEIAIERRKSDKRTADEQARHVPDA